jgi:hypothetical protein
MTNEYYQLSILSLFAGQDKFDNLPSVLNLYHKASPYLRREIILCAAEHNATDWLRELKEAFSSMDSWNRRASIFASSTFPSEERKFF